MNNLKILSPGMLTTVQDGGRANMQHLGIPACGAMDFSAMATANILVGNKHHMAVLECTWSGPIIEFNASTLIALTGAKALAKLNNYQVPMYTTLKIQAGDILDLTVIESGARLYIAIAGGIDVPAVLGSKSTYLPIQFGAIDRRLKKGDVLPIIGVMPQNRIATVPSVSKLRHNTQEEQLIRIVHGPQIEYFSDEAKQALSSEVYTLSPQSDRMGLRFEGIPIDVQNTKPMISDGIPLGSIQITRGGQPIIMMADRQPTGGYPKIAKVIHSDLPKLAQLRPQDRVRFMWVDLNIARSEFLAHNKLLEELEQSVSKLPEAKGLYRIYIDGSLYQTSVIEEDCDI